MAEAAIDLLENTECFHKIEGNYYINKENEKDFKTLAASYNELPLDTYSSGNRRRAYQKIEWDYLKDKITLAKKQSYSQTKNANIIDGGIVRNFEQMKVSYSNNLFLKEMVRANLNFMKDCRDLKNSKKITIGMHQIRYEAKGHQASYASPVWLHVDDEPLVFIHLIHLSKNTVGGDNLIASNLNKIDKVIRLSNAMDSIILNKKKLHAVTPLASNCPQSKGIRDIILFTIEKIEKNLISQK